MTTITITLDPSSVIPIWWNVQYTDWRLLQPGDSINVPFAGASHLADGRFGIDDPVFIHRFDPGTDPTICSGSWYPFWDPYVGTLEYVLCVEEGTADVKITEAPGAVVPVVATPIAGTARLIVDTAPSAELALPGPDGSIGDTPCTYEHSLPEGEVRERVTAFSLNAPFFKLKEFNKTLRVGMDEYALYRLSPAVKIKGTTKKSKTHAAATFTFTLLHKYGEQKNDIYRTTTTAHLINQTTKQSTEIAIDVGVGIIGIAYADPFFASGKNKLVCILDNTADRIRTFRTITVSKIAGDAVGIDEEWHDEDDDTSNTTDSIDAAYAGIGQ